MKCKSCKDDYNFLNGHHGVCDKCHTNGAVSLTQEIAQAKDAGLSLYEFRNLDGMTKNEYSVAQSKAKIAQKIAVDLDAAKLAAFILTTETCHNLPVTERLGIVTAEAVMGMNLIKEFKALVRDIVGGRSEALQKGLRDAREICLTELKRDAIKLGADAVVGIDLDYQDIGGNSVMLMVVASGTAVKL